MHRASAIFANESGTSAIEFAIVGPIFLSMLVGLMYLCMLLFSMSSLQYAVEEGARCASVKTTICGGGGAVLSYTQNAYFGPVTPTFTYAMAPCGHAVTGTTTFKFDYVLGTANVPLKATACFP
jgi:hypothetical protein